MVTAPANVDPVSVTFSILGSHFCQLVSTNVSDATPQQSDLALLWGLSLPQHLPGSRNHVKTKIIRAIKFLTDLSLL